MNTIITHMNKDNRKRQLFRLLAAGIVTSFVLYGFAIAHTTLAIADADADNQAITDLETEIAELEAVYFTMVNNLSIEEAEENKIFWDAFEQLGQDCQKLMRLFFDKVRMEKIAELMGFGSVSYAKKRKFQCKERLVNLVKEDLRFQELKP